MKPGTLLIRADSNVSIGTGHVMRCLALAQAWQEAGGVACFAVAEIPELLGARLRSNGFSLLPIQATAGSSEDVSATVAHAREIGVDWIVVDGDHFSKDFLDFILVSGFRLLLLDDSAQRTACCADLIVNPNLGADTTVYRSRGCKGRILAGLQYVLLRREFHHPYTRIRKNKPTKILITMGGSDPDNLTVPIVRALESFTKTQLTVVAGAGCTNLAELGRLSVGNLRLLIDVQNMAELMTETDLTIIAAGGTLWELLSQGCVVLSYSRNNVQKRMLQSLANDGVVINLGETCHFDPGTLVDSVERLANATAVREQMSMRGRALIDGLGAARVIEALRECGERGW